MGRLTTARNAKETLRNKPDGSEPLATFQVYGGTPPSADKVNVPGSRSGKSMNVEPMIGRNGSCSVTRMVTARLCVPPSESLTEIVKPPEAVSVGVPCTVPLSELSVRPDLPGIDENY